MSCVSIVTVTIQEVGLVLWVSGIAWHHGKQLFLDDLRSIKGRARVDFEVLCQRDSRINSSRQRLCYSTRKNFQEEKAREGVKGIWIKERE